MGVVHSYCGIHRRHDDDAAHTVIVIAIAGVVIAIAALHLPRRHNERRREMNATPSEPVLLPLSACPPPFLPLPPHTHTDTHTQAVTTTTHSFTQTQSFSSSFTRSTHIYSIVRFLHYHDEVSCSSSQLRDCSCYLAATTHTSPYYYCPRRSCCPCLLLSLRSAAPHTFALINQHFQFMALV